MPPKEFEMGAGYLYDMDGNCLGSFESIEEMECETIDSFGFLTKRQNHLYKYGKYRVRKKWNNKIKKILGKEYRYEK